MKKAVSHCWHCAKQLVRFKGGYYFALVRDPDGNTMRVHKDCLKHAVGHGYTEATKERTNEHQRPRQMG